MNLPTCNLKFLLTDEMILRAAAIFDLDEATLRRLNDMALLNTEYIRNAIIIRDYEKLTKGLLYLAQDNKAYTYSEIRQAIAKKYRVTPEQVSRQVSSKTKKGLFYCKECGKIMKEAEWKRTGGVCSSCFVDQIEM
ncbi:hypothetical protein E5358_12615 [Palleniella muris]|uniref:Uncharacterized protein n=1 Tax=Palleniella muris TaxID=3038145 RepID=A0AC61QMB4_9BACT|nr:hypothetical protein [Palleniella muris]TGX80493.1 hypothetical protein E5358_12615 [Palleniella muris]